MNQVRLQKTPDIEEVLAFLQRKYRLLSEAEIIKVALSEKYTRELQSSGEVRKAYDRFMAEGKKLGDKLLSKKGLKRENVKEEEFYNRIIDPRDNA